MIRDKTIIFSACLVHVPGCLVTGLRDVHITVPKAVRRGDSVVLHCHYDLEGDPLYALKWYKGRAEFYRYTPNEKPPMKVFPIPGLSELNVDVRLCLYKQISFSTVMSCHNLLMLFFLFRYLLHCKFAF